MQKLYQPRFTLMNKEVDSWKMDDAGHWYHNTATHSGATGLNPVCAVRLQTWFFHPTRWPVGECLNAKPTAEWTGFLLTELNTAWKGL